MKEHEKEHEEFGEFVRALRKLRLFNNTQRKELQQWTQEYLAKRASKRSGLIITPLHVARIEQGKVRDVKPFLDPLAQAFDLGEAERELFYAIAGFFYRNERKPDRKEIGALFQMIEYPAFARTPLWDFIAFNKYNYILWGYTGEKIEKLKAPPLGPNLLKVLLDPVFESQLYKGGGDLWDADVRRSIQAFRFESFRHINTKRHRQIIQEMLRYPPFLTRWNTAEPAFNPQDTTPTRPIARVFHPQYGLLEFLSLRTPAKYLGSVVDISIYVPLSSYVERFEELQRDAKKLEGVQDVYFFD